MYFSCAIFPVGANNPLNESNEELRLKHLCFNFSSRLCVCRGGGMGVRACVWGVCACDEMTVSFCRLYKRYGLLRDGVP